MLWLFPRDNDHQPPVEEKKKPFKSLLNDSDDDHQQRQRIWAGYHDNVDYDETRYLTTTTPQDTDRWKITTSGWSEEFYFLSIVHHTHRNEVEGTCNWLMWLWAESKGHHVLPLFVFSANNNNKIVKKYGSEFPFLSSTKQRAEVELWSVPMVLCGPWSIVRSVMTCAEIKVIGHSDRGSCRSQQFSAIYNLALICRFLITLRWLLLTHKKFNRFRLDCTSRNNIFQEPPMIFISDQLSLIHLKWGFG